MVPAVEPVLRQARIRGLQTGWLETAAPSADAPILLCLHGYPDSPEIWDLQRRHFESRFQVVCPFARGLAPSESTRDVGRYGQQAGTLDVLQILREVDPSGRRPVALLGHDLGAVHACHLAPHLGRRLSALIIFNGMSLAQMVRRLRRPKQLTRSWYLYLFQIPGLPEWVAGRFPGTARALVARTGGSGGDVPRVSGSFTAPVNQYRAFLREVPRTIRRGMPRVTCPVLVIWGRHDPFLVAPTLDEWEPISPDVTVRLLDAGHWVYRERADEVNRLLMEFLERARLAPPKETGDRA